MRVIIQGIESGGMISSFAEEFRRRGDEVITIAWPERISDKTYDFNLNNCLVEYIKPRSSLLALIAKLLKSRFFRLYSKFDWRVRAAICSDCDLYIQVSTCGVSDHRIEDRILRRIKKANAKIVSIFLGSDVRHYPCFKQEFMPNDWVIPQKYDVPLGKKLARLRLHEKYSDAIFSVPDQMGMAIRPYYHLQLPVDCQRIPMNLLSRDRPLVVHAPTNRSIKGSDIIESAFDSLKEEGVPFDYLPLYDIPRESLLRILGVADVLVDQLICHGPGWLGHEAMASGTVVATRFYEDSPRSFRPPVYSIDQFNIKEKLKVLFESASIRRRFAVEGRRYVEENHSVESVVQKMIDAVFNGTLPEYHPSFHYKSHNVSEIEVIEELSKLYS
jgi:hypothetical protein